ncbi:hypothetical protein TEA_028329 [Camellia sinensis var. sinensis]|uniref:Mediator complex subunit 15 KIX domain-containing protein n=2 Tax=Camellia sinensis TaxID=4442 RepID=A0A4S4ERA6_CAMSN|nr:hypothetical protein TEA_028329 [Camellia sinensis var. sinensis]
MLSCRRATDSFPKGIVHQIKERPLAQLYDQGQSLSNPSASHLEASKQLLFQEFQNCIASIVQSSANSTLTVTTATNSTRIPMTNVNKNPNLETAISQRQVQGRQCVLPVVPQPDQQHVQNAGKYPYKQKLEDQLLKQSCNQENIIHSGTQTEIQQGEQKHIISSPSQQSVIVASSVMQPSVMQSAPSCCLQQNPESSVQLPMQSGLQQHPQSISKKQQLQQSPVMHQGTHKLQQPILPLQDQQQQQLPNATNMHDQLNGHQNAVSDMQHQQQLFGQNNHSSGNLQHLSKQSNASSLNGQSSNSSMHNDQENKHMWLQAEIELQQQTQQTKSALLPTEGQSQPPKQQLTSQIQGQLATSLQQDTQQTLQTSGSLLQPHLFEQQKLSSEIQSSIPVVSSMALDYTSQTRHTSGDDWKEELHGKIKTMKDLYLPELKELYEKISIKLHQPQFQNAKLQSNGNLTNPHLQSMNSHHNETAMEKNNVTNLTNASTISSEVPTSQQNMINLQQLRTNSNSEQAKFVSLLLKNHGTPIAESSQSCSSLSQSGGNMPGKKINHLEMNSSMLQNKCLKQLNEPQMTKAQQAKQQFQQRQMTKQLMQKKEHIELQHHQQPAMLLAQQSPQLYQMNEVNSMKVRRGMGVKAGNCLQHHSVGKLSVNNPCFVKPEAVSPMSLPQLLQTASPQIPQHCSPLSDQKILQTSFRNSGNRLQSSNSMSVAPPSTSLGPLPIKGDSNRLTSVVSPITNSANNEPKETSDALALDTTFVISTPGLSPSLLLAESDLDQNHNHVSTTEFCEPSVTGEPIQQLIKVVRSMSYEALSSSVSDMESIVRMVERTAGSIPGNSITIFGEDLVPVTNFCSQGAKLDGNSITMKMRRYARAMPSNTVASDCITDSFIQFTDPERCDESSTATSHNKRPRVEVNWTLLKEIREINQQLIDTVVDISEVNSTAATSVTEGGKGTIVKCSFNAMTINPNMKTEPASAPVSPILPLRLLVPRNYPACSPVLLDKLPAEVSMGSEDLSVKAKSRLSIILRNVLQPMSLGEIAKNWDVCARAVISEYAEQNGGGTFSSKYGTWENYLSAA